ncbi:MAG: hypothetical protein KIG65_00140 [Eubacteriales bacterium]|nr:hypothetical protein [Eubacteriales bacterium]
MLVNYSNSIAYICPYCGRLTEKDITLFDLPASGAVFCCSENGCGEPIITVNHKKDKYVFEVLCTACDDRHKFVVSRSGFWRKELMVLTCPQTTVDIMFVGNKQLITEELKKQNELYREAEAEISANPGLSIYFDIIRFINDIAKNNLISCLKCPSESFDIELDDSGIRITCRDCHANKVIPISPESLKDLLTAGTIVLE